MKFLLALCTVYSIHALAHQNEVPAQVACEASLTADSINNLVMDLAKQNFESTLQRQIQIVESGQLKVAQIQTLGQPFGVSVTMEAIAANGGQIEIQLAVTGTVRNLITMLMTLDAQYKNAPIKWLKPNSVAPVTSIPSVEPATPEVVAVPSAPAPDPAPAAPAVVAAPKPAVTQASRPEPRRIGFVEFTNGGRHRELVPPEKETLTEQDPIAYVTQRGKVGWAVIEGRYFMKTDPQDLFTELQKAVPNPISPHVYQQTRILWTALQRIDADQKVVPKHLSNLTSKPGMDLLFELIETNMPFLGIPRHQKDIAVSQQDRRIIIPIAALTKERRERAPKAAPAAAAVVAPPVPVAPPAPVAAPAPSPNPPPALAPRPVIPRVGAENQIEMMLPPGMNLGLYNVIESDLFRHLKLGLPFHLADYDESGVFEQVYNSNHGRETYFVRYRLSPMRGGGQLIEVLSLDVASSADQKAFWRSVADEYGFEDITHEFPVNKGLLVRGKSQPRIHVSKQVHAKLVAKHELTVEIIMEVLGQLRAVSPSSDNPNLFNAEIKVGRAVYRVGVALNHDQVILTTLFVIH